MSDDSRRDEIARIIDPIFWELSDATYPERAKALRQPSLVKADAILALPATNPGAETALKARIAELEAALRPFALNPGAISLSKALGHIGREHLQAARAALTQQRMNSDGPKGDEAVSMTERGGK